MLLLSWAEGAPCVEAALGFEGGFEGVGEGVEEVVACDCFDAVDGYCCCLHAAGDFGIGHDEADAAWGIGVGRDDGFEEALRYGYA